MEKFNSKENSYDLEKEIVEKIKIIEGIKSDLNSRIEMMLIILGFSKAGTLDLFNFHEELESIKSKLDKVGLFYDHIRKPPFSDKRRRADLAIANSQENASRLAKLFRELKEENHEEIGLLHGFPKTATEAFVGKKELYEEDPSDYLSEEGIPQNFIGFAFSKDHFKEEVEDIKLKLEAIKKYSPKLYSEIMGSER